MKNITKLTLMTLLAIAFTFVIITPAHANHGVGSGTWVGPNVTYQCLSSLNNLTTTDSVNPCGDIGTAVSTWNNVNSTLTFSKVTSGGETTYGAADLNSKTRGSNSNTISNVGGSVMNYANINFNTDHTWSDRVGGDTWSIWQYYDFISVATHEAGHSVRLAHDSESTLMKRSHSLGQVYRDLSSHDENAVESKYPTS